MHLDIKMFDSFKLKELFDFLQILNWFKRLFYFGSSNYLDWNATKIWSKYFKICSLKEIQSKMAQIIFQQIKQPETQFLNSFQQIFFV